VNNKEDSGFRPRIRPQDENVFEQLYVPTLLKMEMSDPPASAGNPVVSLIKLFLAGNTSGISGFPGIFLF
jgi:hypothetical protein